MRVRMSYLPALPRNSGGRVRNYVRDGGVTGSTYVELRWPNHLMKVRFGLIAPKHTRGTGDYRCHCLL